MSSAPGSSVARRDRELARRARSLEAAPVEQAGERVVVGQVLELALEALALGDIPDRRDHEQPVVGLDRAEADLDRQLAAVLAEHEQLTAAAHRPGRRVGGKRRALPHMGGAEPLRQQPFHRLADQLTRVVPEALRRPAGSRRQSDPVIDYHHRVGRGVEQ